VSHCYSPAFSKIPRHPYLKGVLNIKVGLINSCVSASGRRRNMDNEKKDYLKEFFKKCYDRLEMGESKGGNRFESLDLFEEISNELADISNYAFLQYIKLMRLREKMKSIEETKP
jgi:hypothetical protein